MTQVSGIEVSTYKWVAGVKCANLSAKERIMFPMNWRRQTTATTILIGTYNSELVVITMARNL